MKKLSFIERVCVGCRQPTHRDKLIRLTILPLNASIVLNSPNSGKTAVRGRSAYLCPSSQCVNNAIKSTRLKFALIGRRSKPEVRKGSLLWPLESQLIKDILSICTQAEKTCQNTKGKEA